LALKNGSSLNVDLKEITGLVLAFEAHNTVEITLEASVVDYHGKVQMVWTAKAWAEDPAVPEQQPLASVRLGCSETWLWRMEDVVMRLLYALDFQLAERAWGMAK